MKAQQHTPGPWEVESGMVQTVAKHTCTLPGCGVHVPIALMDRNPGNGTLPYERDANAALIASAPELLRVAELAYAFCVSMSKGPRDAADNLSGELILIISKAKGESQ